MSIEGGKSIEPPTPKIKGKGSLSTGGKRKFEDFNHIHDEKESTAITTPLPPPPPATTPSVSHNNISGNSSSSNLPFDQTNKTYSFYSPEEADLLSILDPMIQSYNIYDMEEFYDLLSKCCDPYMTLKLKYLDYTVIGINPVLIFCNITHECYPDAMLNILERRIVNLTAPIVTPTVESSSNGDKDVGVGSADGGVRSGMSSNHHHSDIKLEYICKFYGTIISNQNIANICKEFLNSVNVPSAMNTTTTTSPKFTESSDPIITSETKNAADNNLEDGKVSVTTSSDSSNSNSNNSSNSNSNSNSSSSNTNNNSNEMVNIFTQINGMKLENLSMDLARFISNNYLPESTGENMSNRQASYFILELLFTLDANREKIIHCDMDILAATEQVSSNVSKIDD